MNSPHLSSGSLTDQAAQGGMVCLVGSGGKTTLMYSLGQALTTRGLRVVCSTTTKIFSPTALESPLFGVFPRMPDAQLPQNSLLTTLAKAWFPEQAPCTTPSPWYSLDTGYNEFVQQVCSQEDDSTEELPDLLPGSVPCPHASGRGRVRGYGEDEAEHFWRQNKVDVLLLEADGSAGRPLKAPASKEPVIPSCTGLVIAVLGLTGLGQTLDIPSVWRFEIFSALSGLPLGQAITPSAVAQVVCHPQGLFKNSPPESRKILFLNEAESKHNRSAGATLAKEVLYMPGSPVDSIYIGSARHPDKAICLYHV